MKLGRFSKEPIIAVLKDREATIATADGHAGIEPSHQERQIPRSPSEGQATRLALIRASAGENLATVVALGLAPLTDVPRPDRVALLSTLLAITPVVGGTGAGGEPDDPAGASDAMGLVADL